MIRSIAKPIFDEYIGKFQIEAIEFENLSLGTLPPTIHGMLRIHSGFVSLF